jgi:hypothetical protein
MASTSVKAEDKLVGAANFNAWKYRIMNILEKNDLEELSLGRLKNLPQTQPGQHIKGNKPRLKESFLIL